MSKMIQIRNVPDDVHLAVKLRATLAGKSLSDFLLAQIEAVARRPTLEELEARIREAGSVELSESTVDALRAERER